MLSDQILLNQADELKEQLRKRGLKTIRILAVDFDGTLTIGNKYPDMGPLRPMAITVLKAFQQEGGKVLLFTCREGDSLRQALNRLELYGFHPDFVNEQTSTKLPGHRKPYYDLLIDDAALGCPLDWFTIGLVLAEFKPRRTKA